MDVTVFSRVTASFDFEPGDGNPRPRMKNRIASAFLLALCMLTNAVRAVDTAPADTPSTTAPRLTPAPQSVNGVDTFRLDLDGTWSFNPALAAGRQRYSGISSWRVGKQPSPRRMGKCRALLYCCDHAAGYARSFTVPASWAGRSVSRARDAVYSDVVVYINGQKAAATRAGLRL